MRRLPGTAVVTALAVLVSVVPARAERSGEQATARPSRPAPPGPGTPPTPGTPSGAGTTCTPGTPPVSEAPSMSEAPSVSGAASGAGRSSGAETSPRTGTALGSGAPSGAVAPATGRQAAFAAAARAYGVPQSVLLGVSYLESRWDGHGGLPSVSAGYGPMHLVDGRAAGGRPHGAGEDPRGDDRRPRVIPFPSVAPVPPEDTLRRAAELSGISPERLRRDPCANIMGGAALLADHQRTTGGDPDAGPAGWYGAVARYSGPPEPEASEAARSFADEVYATIRAGAARVTDDGEAVVLPARPGLVPRIPARASSPRTPSAQTPSTRASSPRTASPRTASTWTSPAWTPPARTAQRRASALASAGALAPVTAPTADHATDPTAPLAAYPAAPVTAPAVAHPSVARPAPLRPAAQPVAHPVAAPTARPAAPPARPATARPPVVQARPPAQARPPVPARSPVTARPPAAVPPAGPDCPRTVSCEWLPAVYQRLKGGGYGNHDRFEGPREIDYIVIHDGETTYDAMTRLAKNPDYLSWHFTIRSRDGHIAQHLRGRDIGWHAGNWYVNSRSIGLEHEGYLARGGTWFTEAMYVASARLVRHLADKYDIPLDRAHILGHDNVPGTTPETVSGMHDDPGPYWDWGHYFELLGSPLRASGGENARSVLIKPHYASNSPGFTGCPGGCRRLGAASVWLRTRPSPTAPLVRDVGKHPTGGSSYSVYDHAARASTGQRYALAGRREGWTAIWYLGQKAWFSDPAAAPTSLPASGPLVTPRPGRAPVKVYGRAYPGAPAYPENVPVQPLVPLQYSIPAGQVYSVAMTRRARYLRAASYDASKHRIVTGKIRYRQIQFGHRVMFVRASDVRPVTVEDAPRSGLVRASARGRR